MAIWEIFKPLLKERQANVGSNETTPAALPFKGWSEGRVETPFIEFLSDERLEELNQIVNWNCFTVDSQGRRFGKAHSAKKRNVPQQVPDRRIVLMNEKFNLADKRVLEVGCFEGVHTTALASFAKGVVAVDSRIENVVKTMIRVGFFARKAEVLCCDLENMDSRIEKYLQADVIHHVGVLYHLKDPVTHILNLKKFGPRGIMLDTHIATDAMANKSYMVNGQSYRYFHYEEKGGYAGVFSGMYDHAKWLTLDDLKKALTIAGYAEIEVIEHREERNGPRCLLIAKSSNH